jgi:hypothetical protein
MDGFFVPIIDRAVRARLASLPCKPETVSVALRLSLALVPTGSSSKSSESSHSTGGSKVGKVTRGPHCLRARFDNFVRKTFTHDTSFFFPGLTIDWKTSIWLGL